MLGGPDLLDPPSMALCQILKYVLIFGKPHFVIVTLCLPTIETVKKNNKNTIV